ncbi:uncharacterized protein HKW66_Vig0044450 [Vigna angularis]|uniref:Leucine-rich repeat-containing N-terminal plant-type domain-containing protein n=1 Tax=Phaseolus angularis TaxID=3914 RepID=A0A8T0KXV9_PHAAN|nr:uncharacterized protein HKW66_Vig0044450 [Vigna angularis]
MVSMDAIGARCFLIAGCAMTTEKNPSGDAAGERLDLSLCHLSGELSNSIGNLSNLSFLDLGGNNFSSIIPPRIGKLHKLQYLGMGDCNLFGSIPQEIGMLTNLELIDLSRNSFFRYHP